MLGCHNYMFTQYFAHSLYTGIHYRIGQFVYYVLRINDWFVCLDYADCFASDLVYYICLECLVTFNT